MFLKIMFLKYIMFEISTIKHFKHNFKAQCATCNINSKKKQQDPHPLPQIPVCEFINSIQMYLKLSGVIIWTRHESPLLIAELAFENNSMKGKCNKQNGIPPPLK